ncbi:MAG: hypothetical protein ACRCX8_14515 [Sarcina sp.]
MLAQIIENKLVELKALPCQCLPYTNEEDKELCYRCEEIEHFEQMCKCGTCRECLELIKSYHEGQECLCTYKTIVDEEGNEIQVKDVVCGRCVKIKEIGTTLDTYDIYEDAYIDEELWKDCYFIGECVYTPIVENGVVVKTGKEVYESPIEIPKDDLTILKEDMSSVKVTQAVQGALIDDIVFEIIPGLSPNGEVPPLVKTITLLTGGNGMAPYLAMKIIEGRDYATVFKTTVYRRYQDEVDQILELEGYGHLINR